ncbi:MAG: (Fe-S)-binding protein [Desulfomonilaceae bacterium]
MGSQAQIMPQLSRVSDPGLDENAKTLTTKGISEVVNRIIDQETAARLRVYLQACVHCGLCSDACHWFLSNNRDPRFSPVGKVRQTLWEMVKRKGRVEPDFIKECSRIAHTECNVCRRCSMYCPFGIDIAYLLLVVRRICSECGLVPQFLQDTVNSHAVTFNQMWVKQDEWIDTLQWQEEEARSEIVNARIPLDREGAEVFYSVIAPEPKILAQLIGNIAQIMAVAGIDWTMPSFDGWDNSNMAMYSGDFETMGRVERVHHEAALRLKVRRIVMGECGHAFRGAVYDGPKWLGWREPPIPVVHAVDFYHELIFGGKIKIARKFEEPVTVQEPCNIIRGRGLGSKLREIIQATCADFRPPEPGFEHNYCCGAGGGVINCGPPWKASRVAGNSVKAEQLAATKARVVITPCHNCHSGIEDIVSGYKLGMHVKFFSEILMQVMEIPDKLKAS